MIRSFFDRLGRLLSRGRKPEETHIGLSILDVPAGDTVAQIVLYDTRAEICRFFEIPADKEICWGVDYAKVREAYQDWGAIPPPPVDFDEDRHICVIR